MLNHQTFLRCSRTTAAIIIFATIALFLLIGCHTLFKSAGLTDEQAAEQTAELQKTISFATSEALETIQRGLSEGHDLKTIAVKTSSAFLWKIITAAGATVGVVLNGLLAKWLTTEKKINKAMITGIESANDSTVKESVHAKAITAGIESKLHARVKALT